MTDKSTDRSDTVDDIAAYWTSERMAGATPRERVPTSTDTPGNVAETAATPAEHHTRPGYNPDEATPDDKTTNVTTARRVPDPTAYPYRTIGKLFFVSDGTDWVGSASTIATDGLITAAHNLYDVPSNSWSSKIRFVPAYTDGQGPWGTWEWAKAWVYDEWFQHDTDAYDVGLIRLDRNRAGQHIGDVLGYLGITVDRTIDRDWIDIGYPSPIDHGRYMIEFTGHLTRTLDAGTVIGKHGTLGKGASGGPWLLYGDTHFVNGVHSFGKRSNPDESFSPYFRRSILDFVKRHF